jgi:hypothetical protein
MQLRYKERDSLESFGSKKSLQPFVVSSARKAGDTKILLAFFKMAYDIFLLCICEFAIQQRFRVDIHETFDGKLHRTLVKSGVVLSELSPR